MAGACLTISAVSIYPFYSEHYCSLPLFVGEKVGVDVSFCFLPNPGEFGNVLLAQQVLSLLQFVVVEYFRDVLCLSWQIVQGAWLHHSVYRMMWKATLGDGKDVEMGPAIWKVLMPLSC
jgi:hypothetical protein